MSSFSDNHDKPTLKTAAEWARQTEPKGCRIADPDGWDRGSERGPFEYFTEEITLEEYNAKRRLCSNGRQRPDLPFHPFLPPLPSYQPPRSVLQ